MLVYTTNEGVKVESENFRIINVPINGEILEEFEGGIDEYKEKIITNENGILNWLQQNDYDIGIAEFNVMAGSFAVFEALGIEETIDVSNSIFLPEYLQFVGINVLDYQVPEYKSAKPGDWEDGVWQKNRGENREEHEESNNRTKYTFTETSKNLYNTLFNNYGISIKKPSTLDLNKFVYIGGILVEDHQLLTGGKQLVENEYDCVILVTFGMVKSAMLPIIKMIRQSIYAGVPLICIPLTGDQIYIASTVEEKGVGIYLNHAENNFIQNLLNALVQILYDEEGNFNFNSKYSKKANKMSKNIIRIYEQEKMKDKFLGKF
uniref:glucuronosyltransferase n=1 Tax=Meloidogyne javanica TaxID=6303 RepID=A0A915LCC8_MELJA